MKLKKIVAFALVLVLTACGGNGKMDGTYAGKNLGKVLTFKPNGKAIYMATEVDYEVDGKDIKLHLPGPQVLILKILDDGAIQFPLLGKLNKVSS